MQTQNMLRQMLLAAAFLSSARGQIQNLVNCGVSQSVNCANVCTSTTIIFYSGSKVTSYALSDAGAKDLLNNLDFLTSRETMIHLHGYSRYPTASGPLAITDACIKKTPAANCMAINATDCFAGSLINPFQYQAAAKNSPCVGRLTAAFLKVLRVGGLSSDNMHLIGHSLGATTMSSTCKYYKADTNETIYRLTALDSAGPCYTTKDNRPQPGDAKYVDAIHSNMALFGTSETLGDADFYPNEGFVQPGCILSTNIACSHARAAELFAESINSDKCIAAKFTSWLFGLKIQRDSTATMGYHWGHEKGNFYLKTNSKSPFCYGTSGY